MLGRLISATTPESGTTTYSYLVSGNPCSGDPSNVCTRTDAGDVTNWQHPAGFTITNTINGAQEITQIESSLQDPGHPQYLAKNITYTPWGAEQTLENGCASTYGQETGCTDMLETYVYNNRMQPVMIELGDTSNAAAGSCLVYNYYGNVANPTSCAIPSQGTGDDGNILGKLYQDNANTSLSHTTALTYDPTHRLTGAVATGSSTYNLAFAYDQFGNMTCQTNSQTQGLCPQYSFSSSTNQITNSGYQYDASGDLISDGTHTYQYDAEGRLVSVDNGTTASYVYNALGERVEKDVGGVYTEYLFDKDGNPEAENNRGTANNGWVDSWVDFEGQHIAHFENNGTYFIHSNQVGTAGIVTDWTGAVIQDELHYPWGQVWTTMGTQTEERFASLHHRDAQTNLDPTHFRMYSSDEGRWLTPDPAQADIYNPQSMSRYAYADLNPADLTDPSGLYLVIGPDGCVYDETDFFVDGYYDSSDYALVECTGGITLSVMSSLDWFYVDNYLGGYTVRGRPSATPPVRPPNAAPPPPPPPPPPPAIQSRAACGLIAVGGTAALVDYPDYPYSFVAGVILRGVHFFGCR